MTEQSPATVLVLGWYEKEQRRIDFVRILSDVLGLTRPSALQVLQDTLTDAVPIAVATLDLVAARDLARDLSNCGCEVRIIDGEAAAERETIRKAVQEIVRAGDSPTAQLQAIREVAPSRRPS